MKAVSTRYIGPTNTKGSRCVATAEGGHRISLPWDSEFDVDQMHQQAARALCQKLGWHGCLVTGGTEKAYVHVFVTRKLESGKYRNIDRFEV